MYPCGSTPITICLAMNRESALSFADFNPMFSSIRAGFASRVGYAFACNPSTSQYQLNVDSIASPASRER